MPNRPKSILVIETSETRLVSDSLDFAAGSCQRIIERGCGWLRRVIVSLEFCDSLILKQHMLWEKKITFQFSIKCLVGCHRGLCPQKGIEGKLETFRRSGAGVPDGTKKVFWCPGMIRASV